MRVGQFFLSEAFDPVDDLFARIFMEEPAEFGAIPELQGAFDDGGGVALRVELAQIVFLKEGRKGGGDGSHLHQLPLIWLHLTRGQFFEARPGDDEHVEAERVL